MSEVTISIITSLYHGEEFFEAFLQHLIKIENSSECELLLVHNDPSDIELSILENYTSLPVELNHIVVQREGLYTSWNRAIRAAKGKYMAIWNVDDIRTPDSLLLQKQVLENSNAVMCYSDFYATSKYGEHKEVFYQYGKDFEKFRKEALKRHIVGGFPMWKKEIHDTIGYFDEQFRVVADWEFQVRTALNFDLVKCDKYTGYFLTDVPGKLSSNRRLQAAEQTVVQIRYKMFHKILIQYLPFIFRFKINKVLSYGNWNAFEKFIPKNSLPFKKSMLNIAAFPFFYCGWIVHKIVLKIYKIVFK